MSNTILQATEYQKPLGMNFLPAKANLTLVAQLLLQGLQVEHLNQKLCWSCPGFRGAGDMGCRMSFIRDSLSYHNKERREMEIEMGGAHAKRTSCSNILKVVQRHKYL